MVNPISAHSQMDTSNQDSTESNSSTSSSTSKTNNVSIVALGNAQTFSPTSNGYESDESNSSGTDISIPPSPKEAVTEEAVTEEEASDFRYFIKNNKRKEPSTSSSVNQNIQSVSRDNIHGRVRKKAKRKRTDQDISHINKDSIINWIKENNSEAGYCLDFIQKNFKRLAVKEGLARFVYEFVLIGFDCAPTNYFLTYQSVFAAMSDSNYNSIIDLTKKFLISTNPNKFSEWNSALLWKRKRSQEIRFQCSSFF